MTVPLDMNWTQHCVLWWSMPVLMRLINSPHHIVHPHIITRVDDLWPLCSPYDMGCHPGPLTFLILTSHICLWHHVHHQPWENSCQSLPKIQHQAALLSVFFLENYLCSAHVSSLCRSPLHIPIECYAANSLRGHPIQSLLWEIMCITTLPLGNNQSDCWERQS